MLMEELQENEIGSPPCDGSYATSHAVLIGKPVTPFQHLLLISADEWELFLVEWAQYQKRKYYLVAQLGGANDYGVDVACFYGKEGFAGKWDNFQCKYYKDEPLTPSTAIPEIGKFLWHIFNEKITAPENYYFFAPKDCGPSLKKLLLDSKKLREKVYSQWNDWCASSITSTKKIALDGDFLKFVDIFDFNIFQYKPVHDVIEEHSKTPHHAIRFGGGIGSRKSVPTPPDEIDEAEVRYTEQLYEAYAEHNNVDISDFELKEFPPLERHFLRQREAFYNAESLRTFARDSVPAGTFEALQNDMYDGVIDTMEDDHEDGYKRLREVMSDSRTVPLDSNGLFHEVRVKDRYGICHQLANEERLNWVKKNE